MGIQSASENSSTTLASPAKAGSRWRRFAVSPAAEWLLLLAIFAVAFIIRYIGLKFGKPLLLHSDEGVILNPVLQMTRERSLNPGSFNRPDQIMIGLNFVFLNLVSFLKTGHDVSVSYLSNPFFYTWCARMLTAAAGAFIPVVAYKIGKENAIKFALPAALLFAFFPVYVLHSHYVTPDIPVTLFTLVILLFALRYVRAGQAKYLHLANLFAAVNTAEKYPGLLSFGIVLGAILWVQVAQHSGRPGLILKRTLIEGLKFFGLYLLCIYILAPNLFIHYGQVLEQLKNEARSTHPGADGLGWWGNLRFYLDNFLGYTNFVVLLLAAVGIVGLFLTRSYTLFFCFYGLAYWVILSKLALHWERWALPMYTFPLLLAAFGLGWLWQVFKTRSWARAALGLVFSLSLGWSLLYSLSLSINHTYTSTIVAALRYAQASGITPENSVYEGYTPFLPGTPAIIDPAAINSNAKYVILSSTMYGRYYREPVRYAQEVAQYEAVRQNATLLREFTRSAPASSTRVLAWLDDLRYYIGVRLGRIAPTRAFGPTIQIYQTAP